MLTITEAMDAIRALNTYPDIILGACKRLTTELSSSTETITGKEISDRLVGEYMLKKPTGEVIQGIVITLVTLATTSVKPGHEVQLLDGLISQISSLYGKALVEICHQQMHTDPAGAAFRLIGIIEGLAEGRRNTPSE